MDAAWVALIGAASAVAGAAVPTVGNYLETRRRDRREERRRFEDLRSPMFVAYLLAYQDVYGLSLAIAADVESGVRPEGAPGGAAIRQFEREASEEVDSYFQAYWTLSITAGARTRDAARGSNRDLWRLADAAFGGKSSDRFAGISAELRESRRALQAAMREELGRD